MPLSDYRIDDDHFEPDKNMIVSFPCYACTHRFGVEDKDPCRTCGHNILSSKYEEEGANGQ